MHLTEFHVAGRQEGKTINSILWMAKHPNSYVIYPNRRQAEHAWNLAMDLGFNSAIGPRQFITRSDVRRSLAGAGDFRLGIENLDHFLREITDGFRLDRATISGTTPKRLWRYEEKP